TPTYSRPPSLHDALPIFDRLGSVPALVGVGRDRVVRPHDLASDAHAARIIGGISAHLELDHGEAVLARLMQEPSELLVAVAQPAGGGGVGGGAVLPQRWDPLLRSGERR